MRYAMTSLLVLALMVAVTPGPICQECVPESLCAGIPTIITFPPVNVAVIGDVPIVKSPKGTVGKTVSFWQIPSGCASKLVQTSSATASDRVARNAARVATAMRTDRGRDCLAGCSEFMIGLQFPQSV